MSKIKDEIMNQTEERERELNVDTAWEHSQHEKFYPNCSKCAKYAPKCSQCNDTGVIEIMGGSDADEWGVVDTKVCECRKD